MIDLTFLGVGSAFQPQLYNTCACFRKGSTLYLADCGSTAMGRLLETGQMKGIERLTVFITHTHADHIGSLGTVLAYCRHVQKMPVTVVHPEEKICAILDLCGIPQERYTYCGGEEYDDGAVYVRFYPVPHAGTLNAYGFTLGDGEETVYYSGDAGEIPQDVWTRFLAGGIARVYQDAALHADPAKKTHGAYSVFDAACPQARRAEFFPIHWDEEMTQRILTDGFGLVKRA